MFELGRAYKRRDEIHKVYGGQEQGGISTPAGHPLIFLFTGEAGHDYGYKDGPDENGVFRYTGEGQVGDMEFTNGNRAIRDHVANGKDIHLFEKSYPDRLVRYLGQYVCTDWERGRGPDREGNDRELIIFHLVPLAELPPGANGQNDGPIDDDVPLDILRQRALAAASAATEGARGQSKKNYYARSSDVRAYVLRRAQGRCESCDSPAPFLRAGGHPYLEPHHTRRLSDGGPDHPRWVGAICPIAIGASITAPTAMT